MTQIHNGYPSLYLLPLKDQHAITDEAAAPSHARMMLEPYPHILLDLKYEALMIAMDVVVE